MKTLREQALPYLTLLQPGVCEPTGRYAPFEATERHLQALWFNSPFRPATLRAATGEEVRIVDPGRWNPEAGPDFLGARFTVDGRPLLGDVEVHIRPADWDRHRHASDPRYRAVALHVVWFSAPSSRTLPPGVLTLPLQPCVTARPGFSFDLIDARQCPREAVPIGNRPCSEHLAARPRTVSGLLKAAGYYRIWQKTRRLLQHPCDDPAQLFYETLMGVMGYRSNSAPFRRLAREIPLARLAGSTPRAAFAALAAAGGLLPDPARLSDPRRAQHARALWDQAWHMNITPPDPPYAWALGGARPANHPLRRLGAVAALLAGDEGFIHRAPGLELRTADSLRGLTDRLLAAARWPQTDTETPVWPASGPTGAEDLMGRNRAQSVVTNALVPLLLAQDRLPPDLLAFLPPEELSAPMKETACRLLGSLRGAREYLASGLFQQGLLQIFADFCQNGRTACAHCPIPEFES